MRPTIGRSGVFYVAPDDPWHRWTNSGISRALSRELRSRGLLLGAASRHAHDSSGLQGRGLVDVAMAHITGRLMPRPKPPEWSDERAGVIGAILRELPRDSVLLYQYIFPVIEPSLPHRRYLLQDLTIRDAVRTLSYGHAGLSESEVAERIEAQRRAIESVDGVIVFSTYTAESLCRDYAYPRHRVTAIGAGPVNGPARTLTLEPERYSAARILFVGRNWVRKGGPELLEAYRLVRRKIPHATLTVVGTAEAPTDEPGVRHVRFAAGKKLARLYAESSVFCMPSVCETWGLVYVEAAQSGLPTVGYDTWGMPDIVVDGETGLLTSDHTSAGLADILLRALQSPRQLSGMGRAAVQRVRDVLDWPHVVDRLLAAVLPSALNGRSAVPLRPPPLERAAAGVVTAGVAEVPR